MTRTPIATLSNNTATPTLPPHNVIKAIQTLAQHLNTLGQVCVRCCHWKAYSEFHQSSKRQSKHQSWCKECFKGYDIQRQLKKKIPNTISP